MTIGSATAYTFAVICGDMSRFRPQEDAQFGVVKINEAARMVSFVEKPTERPASQIVASAIMTGIPARPMPSGNSAGFSPA
ncbi:MAG: hypothetical protein HYX90_01830 [Chloroflexi bacterium]|nr:hypothetical protein [Chloroflexota bacterium]